MTKLFFGILAICLSSSLFSFGQGYRGKRFSLTYQPGYSMVEPSFDFKRIVMHSKLNFGCALGKHFSVNLTGSYTNSRTFESPNSSSYKSVQINDVTGGIVINYYYKNYQSFAPLGRYVGFGVDFGTQNAERIVLKDNEYGTDENKYYDGTKKNRLVIYSFYFGKNFLVKDRLLLGWGIQYGLCSGAGPTLRHCIKPQFNLGIIF
jgi:hypothetical protein